LDRKYIISAAATILIALIGLLAFRVLDKPVAVVNGQSISKAELQRAIKARSEVHQRTGASVEYDALRSSVLDQLISEALIHQGARAAGVTIMEEEVDLELDSIKRRTGQEAFAMYLESASMTEKEYYGRLKETLIKNRFIEDFIFTEEIEEEEIREFYSESPIPFMTPELADVRIVEMELEEEAAAAMKEMRSLGSGGFDKVADRLRDDTTVFVSDYGETNPSFYSGEVGEAMRELEEGRFGGPYKGKEGFYLISVRKRLPARPRTYEEARDEIWGKLYERKKAAAIIHWVANERNKSTIVRN
jgi:parvulin-like peptidyl-prolyl isomerase